jgi:putative adhesin/cell wall-active antibiotic response 4TMS protein YvqF
MNEPRRYYYPRSIFGPLVLISIGVLFLLRNMGVISWNNFGWWFARYWPVLLIVWGVIKFGEYLWARKNDRPTPGIGAGGVVFLVFLIIFGLAASQAAGVNWSAVGDTLDLDFGFGNQYEYTENFSQPLQTATAVKVLSTHGNITVSASPDDQAHAFVHKFLRGASQDQANSLNDQTHPKFQQQGDVLVLDMVSGSFDHGRFDLDLQLPRSSGISVITRRGDIHVSQRDKDVDLESTHGDVFVEDVKGNASLHLRRGDATVKNVAGNVNVDGTLGDCSVSDVGGTVTFSGTYRENIQLSHIAKPVRFSSALTDLEFTKLDGDLTMDRGNFRANAVAGPFRLDTKTKDVHLQDISGDIHIQDTRGDVEVHTKAPLGTVDISNTAGEINVGLPDKVGFQIDAQSQNGEIQSDFSLNVNNSSRNATATGIVGKGGPEVRLRTNRGTIQIHKD